AVAVTKYTDSVSVHIRLFSQPLCAKFLVGKFKLGKLTINTGLKLTATIATAAVIKFEHHIALLHQILRKIIAPAVGYTLCTRAAVNHNNCRMALVVSYLFGFIHLVIQALAVSCG